MKITNDIESQFIEMIHAHEGIIHKVIGLYIDSTSEKEDVKQEVLLQAWKSFSNFKGKSAFSTWLYKVSLNTVLTHRKKDRGAFTDELDENLQKPIEESDQKENYEILYQIIRGLDEIDRMIATLYLDGYKNIEIAEITGMTANQINVKVYRIKDTIKERFQKRTS